MRIAHLGSALTLSLAVLGGPAFAGGAINGDYVEARSCNVFIGGCHYGSEFVTTGREALMAWHVRGGTRGEVDLAGLSAAAVVSADLNLAEPQARHSTILYLDTKATPTQRNALQALLKEKYGSAFGKVVAVRTAPIEFTQDERDYHIVVGSDARLAVNKVAQRTCCTQPMQIWYKPLGPVTDSTVGFASLNEFKGTGLATTWSRVDQNSAFYGAFSF